MPSRFCGGRNRTRTCDPIDVNDVLYRLSHATLYVNRFLSYHVRAHIHGRSSHRKGDLFGFHGFDENHGSYWLAIWSSVLVMFATKTQDLVV